MRRPTLSTKLFAAALPLLVAVGALLALTVRSDLREVQRAETGADLGRLWAPLTTSLTAIEGELAATFGDAVTTDDSTGTTSSTDSAAAGSTDATAGIEDARRATDQSVTELLAEIDALDISGAAGVHVTSARSDLSAARRNVDLTTTAPGMQVEVDPVDAYQDAARELVAIGALLPAEGGEPEIGRELLAVTKLAEARLAAVDVIIYTATWQQQPIDWSPLASARGAFNQLDSALNEFETIAPEEWVADYRDTGYNTSLARYRAELDRALRTAQDGGVASFDTEGFNALVVENTDFLSSISQSIVDRASDEAASARRTALIRIGIILAAALLATAIAWWVTRTVTRRVKAVAESANQVANQQLPALVEALRDPRGNAVLPDIEPVDPRGTDELAELAQAFNSMQGTLVNVAQEQVEVLRRGVSDIFVTMARRNRSLIDRQLAMLDEFEAEVEDPEVLSNYYQLDHMATRMRRNSESLLVLANAEPKRRRVKATEIDDVVRAAIGEVEDYRRIEVEHLESLQVRGNVVADISHLVAELLDNATSFSPPDSPVRVGGRRTGDGYMLRIVDSGVGIGPERMQELNELLAEPPLVGLSVESTLGMSVVSLLANKHGIGVTLTPGGPGLIVDIVIPSSLFGPIDAPAPTAPAAADDPYAVPATDPYALPADPYTTPAADPYAMPVADPYAMPADPYATPAADPYAMPTADPYAMPADPYTAPAADPYAMPTGQPAADPYAMPTGQPAADPYAMPAPSLGNIDISALRGDAPAPDAAPEPPAPPSFVPPAPTASLAPLDAPVEEPPVVPSGPDPILADAPPSAHAAPAAHEANGEFDVPPAPPLSADGLSRRPVAPDGARPAPSLGTSDDAPLLPVRSRGGSGPEGPDRLADPQPAANGVNGSGSGSGSGEPSALQAALAAFDAGRSADPTVLPTRAPGDGPADTGADGHSTAPSRMDPDALRERLRAFQSEFKTGLSAPKSEQQSDIDLGGDPR